MTTGMMTGSSQQPTLITITAGLIPGVRRKRKTQHQHNPTVDPEETEVVLPSNHNMTQNLRRKI